MESESNFKLSTHIMNPTFEIIPFTIEITGEVRENNLAEVMPSIREWLESINRNPKTDEEFGDAELDVKRLSEAEKRLKEAKDKAISDAASIQELFKAIDDASEEIRSARLELEKTIAAEKEKRKSDIVEAELDNYDIDPMDARRHFLSGLQNALKGKRTIDSMAKACRIYQATTQATIHKSRAIIEQFEKAHGSDMILDRRELELKNPESVEAELRRRFEAKRAADERKRLEAEAAKAKQEAQAAIDQAEAAKAPGNVVPMKGMLPQNDLPQPPKIGGIPTGPSPAAEWESWKTACKTTFGALKVARESLRHAENIERAAILADGINAAWKAMNEAREEVAS